MQPAYYECVHLGPPGKCSSEMVRIGRGAAIEEELVIC